MAHAIQMKTDRIFLIRGKRVILDSYLAELYGVPTKRLNQQVRRNLGRFPEDFAFPLSDSEWESLRLQIATSKPGRGGQRHVPYAFTEHGALMAATVLNSPKAIEVSIYVVRAFAALKESAASREELRQRLDDLERRIEGKLANQDRTISEILAAIRSLMDQPKRESRPIGFITPK